MALTDPVPSQAIDVFKRNMEDSDRFVNQTSGTVTNRTGKTMRPLPVISDDIEQQITDLTADINAAKADLYPIVKFRFLVDTYEIANRNELGDTATGETYRYVGATLPFNVTPAINPVGNPDFAQVIQTDHNNLTNRNATDAHDASAIAYSEGGANSVESALRDRAVYMTLAEAQVAALEVGQYVRLIDRGLGLGVARSGVSPEPLVHAQLTPTMYLEIQVINNKPEFSHFGVVDDPSNLFASENTTRIQACLNAGGKVQGIPRATYYLTREIVVPEYTTYYAKQALHKQHSSFTYTGTSYSTVIILGDKDNTTGNKKLNCHIIGARVEEDFLGDPTVVSDIDNILNYTSIAQYGIRAQLTDMSSIKGCTVSGMPTSAAGAEWSDNFKYSRNKLLISRFHGIANQGGTASARSHKVLDNVVIGCGGMAFDINTAAGGTVELSGNVCRNVRQFYKCTDGTAFSSNNECHSWSERDDIYSAYGNSKGLNCVNDKLYNFARLTASGSTGANYQWTNITYISDNGTLLTVFDNTTYKISDSVISIVTDKDLPIVGFASGAAKEGFSFALVDSELSFNTTGAANSSSQGVFSLGGWKNANINISNNKKFVCVGLSSQRVVIDMGSDITSTAGLANFSENNVDASGFDPQLGLFFKDAHNTRVTENNLKGISLGSYESSEDNAVNFIQHSNISDTEFTLNIGVNNRIYDYRSVGRSGTTTPIGNKTPKRIGERYFHWTIGDFYQAYGTGVNDWRKLN